jgi:hypothetical protein
MVLVVLLYAVFPRVAQKNRIQLKRKVPLFASLSKGLSKGLPKAQGATCVSPKKNKTTAALAKARAVRK